MRVEELIAKLQGMDPKAVVKLADSDGHSSYIATDAYTFEKDGQQWVVLS